MQNLISIWSALDLRKKAIVLGATAAMFLAVLGLARMAGSPQMVLLYAGLEAGTAGELALVGLPDREGYEHWAGGEGELFGRLGFVEDENPGGVVDQLAVLDELRHFASFP